MNRIYGEGLYTRCVIYVDDILVFGKDKQTHDKNLAWVLAKAIEHNVKIKFEKCKFAFKEVDYLGFRISGNHIEPLKDKLDSLLQTKAPRDRTELRSIVGKLNFYSRFIPNYSKLLEPFRQLLQKNRDFQWKEDHQKALVKLIKQINQAPRHCLAPRSKENVISIQVLEDSIEAICLSPYAKLVHRTSRLLTTTEANYSAIEKQLLALTLAVNKFKLLLDPELVKVKTSCKDLDKVLKLVNRPERVESLLLKLPAGFDSFKFIFDNSLIAQAIKNIKKHTPEEIYYIDGACEAKLSSQLGCMC